jgi:hypothetical protein
VCQRAPEHKRIGETSKAMADVAFNNETATPVGASKTINLLKQTLLEN